MHVSNRIYIPRERWIQQELVTVTHAKTTGNNYGLVSLEQIPLGIYIADADRTVLP